MNCRITLHHNIISNICKCSCTYDIISVKIIYNKSLSIRFVSLNITLQFPIGLYSLHKLFNFYESYQIFMEN